MYPNPEIEKLRAKQKQGQKKLEQLQHREQQLQNRIRYLEGTERRQRSHRLITRGAAVEHAYKEQSSYSTIDFVQRAIIFFGYAPETIQTDNGAEFTHSAKTERIHPFDLLCMRLHIRHKTIRPKTPWHNGKVERSHRNDQERFYNYLMFYSYEDLQLQMKRYLRRSNHIPMSVLAWKSPDEMRREFETARVSC